jgi:hypothetical protein
VRVAEAEMITQFGNLARAKHRSIGSITPFERQGAGKCRNIAHVLFDCDAT